MSLDCGGTLLELLQLFDPLLQLVAISNDADMLFHRGLQVVDHDVGVFTILAVEEIDHRAHLLVHLFLLYRRCARQFIEVGLGTETGAGAEDDQVGETVATESVGTV